MPHERSKEFLVRHRDRPSPIDRPFGHVQQIVTGGEGGVVNVGVVRVTQGLPPSASLPDDDLLARLLELNLEQAEE